MGSPYQFPSSPQEDYYGAYNRWNNTLPQNDFASYLDPQDPEVEKYRNFVGQDSGAGGLVSNFINSMPKREDYNPSIWRKLGGALIGILERSGYQGARNFVEEPYKNAYNDWSKEGQFIDDRARLLEADKSREVKAMEFALKTKNDAARRKAGLDSSRMGQVGVNAGRDVANADRDRAFNYRTLQDEIDNKLARERLNNTTTSQGLTNQIHQLQLDYMKAHGTSMPTTRTTQTKPVDPMDLEAKRTRDIATIKEGINAEVMADPQFARYFNPDGSIKPELDQKTRSELIAYLNGELQKKLVILGGR